MELILTHTGRLNFTQLARCGRSCERGFRQPRQAFAHQQGMGLSVGSTKTLLHNAAMVDRFIAMSGKSPNMRLNNTDFKELLFYGVRAAV